MASAKPDSATPRLSKRLSVSTAGLPLPFAGVMAVFIFWAADSMSPALNDLRDDLNMSGAAAGLVFSLYFCGRLLGGFPAGRLADRIGPPLTAALGATFLMIGGVIAAVAINVPMVLGGRLLEGAGVALMVTAVLLSILRVRPAGGAAMAFFTTVSTVGSMLGLVLGGIVTGIWGWRITFSMHALIAAAALALALIAWSRQRRAAEPDAPSATSPVPSLPRRSMSVAMLNQLLVYMNYSIFVVSLPLYAAARFDADPEQVAILLLVQTVTHFVCAYPGGWLVRRFGSLPVLTGSIFTAGLGMASALLAPAVWWLVLPMVIYSTGQVTAVTSAGDYILQKGGRSGQAVGWLRLSGDAGLVIGPVMVGFIADIAGYRAPFVILPLITITGVMMAIVSLRRAERDVMQVA